MKDVYRIECAISGLGVYRCGARDLLETKGTALANRVEHLLGSAPMAWNTPTHEHVRDLHNRDKHFFGWLGMDEAESYFKHELNKVFEALHSIADEYPMLLVRFEVPEEAVIEADTQCIFEKERAQVKQSWTMAEALNDLQTGKFYEPEHNRPDSRSSIPALDNQYNPS